MLVDQRTGQVLDIIKQNEDGNLVVAKEACDFILNAEQQMKQIKEAYAEYKEALKQAMEEHGVEKIQTDNFTVSYVKATERVGLDVKQVEKKYPEVSCDPDCLKITDVKASVRVRLK